MLNVSNNLCEECEYIYVEDILGFVLKHSVYIDAPSEVDIDYDLGNLNCFEDSIVIISIDSVYNTSGD